jgi:hypothetical protein
MVAPRTRLMGPTALARRSASAVLEDSKGPRRKVVRPALDDVYNLRDLARRVRKLAPTGYYAHPHAAMEIPATSV